MNILFVAPPFPGRVSEYLILPSLELCIQSAILKKQGHTVELLDMKIDHLTIEDVRQRIDRSSKVPSIVLIDDSPEVHCITKELIKLFRQKYGDTTKIVLRGEIPTFIPNEIMERNLDLDYILRYDDDYALTNIIQCLSNKAPLEKVNNIVYRTDSSVICTQSSQRTYKLDDLPYPDRKLYDIKKYLARDSETIVRSSRGCPGNCLFCIKTRYEQFGVFSISRFVDEIEELQNMGFESFFFSDDTFAFSDARLTEFANEIKKRNIKVRFTSNIRIKDINEYKVRLLKEIGAYRVFVGIETINSRSSTIINKNLHTDEIREKINLLHKYGIEFHASFILGSPGDSEDDLAATIDFVKDIKPTIVTFNLIKAYPGLPLYHNPEKYGIVMDDPYWYEKDEWSRKCVMGTTLLPPEKLEQWSRRMLFEFIGGNG